MRRLAMVYSVIAVLALCTACTAPSSEQIEGDGLHSMVPSVTGLEQAAARSTLEDAGYVIGKVTTKSAAGTEPGTVIGQSPIAGTSAPRKSEVDLVIAEP